MSSVLWSFLATLWDMRPLLTPEESTHSVGITWTDASRPDKAGQTARNANLCKIGEIHRRLCNQKHWFYFWFSLLQFEIWEPIVVMICYIFYEYYIIVNTVTYFNSLLFWMIAQNVRENVTNPRSTIALDKRVFSIWLCYQLLKHSKLKKIY